MQKSLLLMVFVAMSSRTFAGDILSSQATPAALSEEALKGTELERALRDARSTFGEWAWFPSMTLEKMSLLTYVRFAGGRRYVLFSMSVTVHKDDGQPTWLDVPGPAVLFPLIADKEPKFKKLRRLTQGKRVVIDVRVPHMLIAERGVNFILMPERMVDGPVIPHVEHHALPDVTATGLVRTRMDTRW